MYVHVEYLNYRTIHKPVVRFESCMYNCSSHLHVFSIFILELFHKHLSWWHTPVTDKK